MPEAWIPILLAAMGAIFYLMGFAYLDGYYEYYDISVGELGLGVQQVLSYSYSAVSEIAQNFLQQRILVVVIATVVVTTAVLLSMIVILTGPLWNGPVPRQTLNTILVVLLVCVLGFGPFLAHQAGKRAASSEVADLLWMKVLDADAGTDVNAFLEREDDSKRKGDFTLRHLLTTADTHYAVATHKDGVRRWIIRIPKEEVEAVWVWAQHR